MLPEEGKTPNIYKTLVKEKGILRDKTSFFSMLSLKTGYLWLTEKVRSFKIYCISYGKFTYDIKRILEL